jgi:hypothetical protein
VKKKRRNMRKIVIILMALVGIANAQNPNLLPAAGNVGVGTTSPIAPLQIFGDMVMGNTVAGGRWQFHTQSWMPNGDLLIAPDDNTGNFNFDKGIRIQRDGTTYLHTGAPISKISIGTIGGNANLFSGNGYIGLNMTRNTTSGKWTLKTDNTDNGGSVIFNDSQGEMYIANVPSGAIHPGSGDQYPNDGEVKNYTSMRIKWDQNTNQPQVQIGKTTQVATGPHTDYRLSVDGKLVAQEIYVTMNDWADYVFAPGYELMKLDSLEKYIQDNNHLPNVPTTEEVMKNGNNSGETDRILLEKIEELSLYIIEQNKRIKELEQAVIELKK